jgi:hypothetical protein
MAGMELFPRCHLNGEMQANRSMNFFHEEGVAVGSVFSPEKLSKNFALKRLANGKGANAISARKFIP